jgi:DNA-binding MarR family transcriptional regulator
MDREIEEDILRALRRITRAIDIHSRRLVNTYGLTGPQLLCLRTLDKADTTTLGRLADELSLSQSTITGIVDRLEARQLVARERSAENRRKVTVSLTDAGRALVVQAPSPLQESLITELRKLDAASQTRIRDHACGRGGDDGRQWLGCGPRIVVDPDDPAVGGTVHRGSSFFCH